MELRSFDTAQFYVTMTKAITTRGSQKLRQIQLMSSIAGQGSHNDGYWPPISTNVQHFLVVRMYIMCPTHAPDVGGTHVRRTVVDVTPHIASLSTTFEIQIST